MKQNEIQLTEEEVCRGLIYCMCLWIRKKKRVTVMRVRISCNRFPLRVSFISAHCQYSPCVRWPCSPSSSPRGKESHKSLSLSLPFLLVPSLILCAETGGRQGGKVCVLLSFVCVSWETECVLSVHLLWGRMTRDKVSRSLRWESGRNWNESRVKS